MPSSLRSLIARATSAALADGTGPTDGQLLAQFVDSGDAEAFAVLVRRHGRMVYGVCRRILGREEGVDDAFQAVFVVLAQRAGTVRPREAVGNWLYGVAVRTARSARAKMTRRKRHETPLATEPTEHAEPEPPVWVELLPRLDQEIERLPDRYRLPVVLCELQGRSRRDVARQLGLKEGTLSSRLAYARKLLTERLKQHCPGLTAGGLIAVFAGLAPATSRIPVGLAETTSMLATNLGGVVPTAVQALSEGTVKVMLLSKLKLLALGLLAAGAWHIGSSPAARGTVPFGHTSLAVSSPKDPVPKLRPVPKEWVPGESWVASKSTINVVLFSPDGKTVFSGVSLVALRNPALPDKPFQEFRSWEAATGKPEQEFRDEEAGHIMSVGVAPDRKRGAYGTKDGRVIVWDEVGGKPVMTAPTGTRVAAVAVAQGGKIVVTGGDDGVARVWDVTTGKEQATLRGHTGTVSGAAISPDGKTVATGGEDETIRFWDATTGKELRRSADAGWVCGLTFTPDGKRLLSGNGSGIRVWDAATGKRLHSLAGMVLPGCGVPLSPDGTLTAGYALRADGKTHGIAVSDVATGQETAFLPMKVRSYRQVAFSPDGKRLVISGGDEQEQGVLETWVVK